MATLRPLLGVVLICGLVLGPLPVAARQQPPSKELQLRPHLSRDPLFAMVLQFDDPGQSFDGMLEMLGRFADEQQAGEVQKMLREADAKLGMSLRDDVLAQLGPEIAVVLDLPAIDRLVAGFSNPTPETTAELLGGSGLLMQVRDAAKAERALARLFELAEATLTRENGVVRAALSIGDEQQPQAGPQLRELPFYFALRDNRLALGFSPAWVRATLDARPAGERLADGSDFARVFSHLDARPENLFYINLPKIATHVRESQLLGAMMQANPQARALVDTLLTPEFVGIGIGTTSVELEDGVRQTSFGPRGLSAGAFSTGIIAAIAIPNLLNAIDRGKQKRTMADLRSLGTVCEAYAVDNGRYPGPTQGWVPVEQIASQVEPVYIRTMPRVDGWGRPILYWSDGEIYRIVSHGKDGEPDQDYSAPIEPRATTEPSGDIVFGDGEFLVYPQQTSQ